VILKESSEMPAWGISSQNLAAFEALAFVSAAFLDSLNTLSRL
jgi:hypothetical protein